MIETNKPDTVLLQFLESVSKLCGEMSNTNLKLLDIFGVTDPDGNILNFGLYQTRFKKKILTLTENDLIGTGFNSVQDIIDICEALPVFNYQVSLMGLKTKADKVKPVI